jgi:hypothetical protein
MVFTRKTLEFLDSFGQWGSAPVGNSARFTTLSVDSTGNLLHRRGSPPLKPVNRRIQKFAFVGMKQIPPVRVRMKW